MASHLHPTRYIKPVLIAAVLWTLATAATIAQPPPSPALTFDVATIKQNISGTGRSHIYNSDHNGQFTTINLTLKSLLKFAFEIPETQISGIPEPLNSQKFDIEARSDPSVDDQLSKLSFDQATPLKRSMVQALLTDRFKLVTHTEIRQLPVFNLVIAKNGSKLQESKADGRTYNTGSEHISDQGVTIPLLADQLASRLDRPVIDKTALTGRYDLTLKWTPDGAETTSDSAPSIFTAIQEQLGLKLESTKGPVETLVIDHIEEPSPN
jgi:uncharacterized protein (TIGR03435 family)